MEDMKITLEQVGKRFSNQWLFKNIHYQFSNTNTHVITGANGSGKSTLMHLISGYMSPTEGVISYSWAYQPIDIGFSSPLMELPEELTLRELIDFHKNNHVAAKIYTTEHWLEHSQLQHVGSKPIKYFSSGMKQRVKIALATKAKKVWLLDEPTTNLDQKGIDWYQSLIANKPSDVLCIIASNALQDYSFMSYTEFSIGVR